MIFSFQNSGCGKTLDYSKWGVRTQKKNTINIWCRPDRHPYSDRQTCRLKSHWQQQSRGWCIMVCSEADTLNLASSVLFTYHNTAREKSTSKKHLYLKKYIPIVADIILWMIMLLHKDNLQKLTTVVLFWQLSEPKHAQWGQTLRKKKKQNLSKFVGCYLQCSRHSAATKMFSHPSWSHQTMKPDALGFTHHLKNWQLLLELMNM